MAKAPKSQFICQACGSVQSRWVGKCPDCGEWNSLVEETNVAATPGSGLTKSSKGRTVNLETLAGASDEAPRMPTGNVELDRVTGGGIVPGSAILIGGEPGIGKSTLLLQVAAALASDGRRALYFSGEEATAQVRLRAARLGLTEAPVGLASETNLSNILATMGDGARPDLVIVDSIPDALGRCPGRGAWHNQPGAGCHAKPDPLHQVGRCSAALGWSRHKGRPDRRAKGDRAHGRHRVLYFEGDRGQPYRILRAVKNRFGPADEIGVFEMAQNGLQVVRNPSELFLGDRDPDSPGAAVFAGVEGTRANPC